MKRIILAGVLAVLSIGSAHAQCSGIQPVTSVCGNPGAAGAIAAPTQTPVIKGVTVNPTASTTNRAFVSTQTGPTTSTAGPVSFNLFNVTQRGPATGSGFDAYGLFNKQVISYRFNTTIGASTTLDGTISGGTFAMSDLADTTAVPPEKIGANATIYSTTTNGGNLYGFVAYNILDNAGVKVEQVGLEIDVAKASTATLTNRHGLRIVNVNLASGATNGAATTIDNGITFANLGTVGGGFKALFGLQQTGFANPPLLTTASFFVSDAAITVANIFNMANVNVTGSILTFPNVSLGASGDFLVGLAENTSRRFNISNTHAGTSALATYQVTNSAGVVGNFAAGSPAYTGIPLLANRIGVQANANSDGIAIVTSGVDPVKVGINDLETAEFTTTRGQFRLGVAGAAAGVLEFAGSGSGSHKFKAAAAAGSGTTTWPAGTTDFSATGGTSQVVRQPTAGGPFTVGTVASTELSDTAAIIRTVKKQIFTSNGTYTPSAGMIYAIIECLGGGGGGGASVGATGALYSGGGGGAGSYSRVVVTAATIGASKTVTVGTGGNGGAAGTNNGAAGTDSCVTSSTCTSGQICAGKGGSGGLWGGAAQGGAGGAGGVAGTGDVTGTGMSGGTGEYSSIGTVLVPSGFGGSSGLWGGGGAGVVAAASNGNPGTGFGAGGSGGPPSTATGTDRAGGNGSPTGLVAITEYNSQ